MPPVTPHHQGPEKANRLLWVLVTMFAVVKMALVGWWPFLSLTHLQHDTGVFLTQATYLLMGEWLGPYSEFTLMKGPATAIWIALMNLLGIPLLMSHHLGYIGACVLLMLAFRRLTTNTAYLLFVFVLALFNPFSFNYGPIAAAFREMLHQPVVLSLVALSILLFADFMHRRRVNWGLCVLFGVMLWLFWNNREEGVWIVPWLCWLLAFMLADVIRSRGDGHRQVLKLALLAIVPSALWGLGTLALAWKNHAEYGVFAVVELKTPEFKHAFGGLLGIKSEQWRQDYPAPPDVLDKLYALSSGRELDLDGKDRKDRQPIHAVRLPWAFRTAVENAGYYARGGAAVLEFYDRLGSEIDAACGRRDFECREPTLGLLPPWDPHHTQMLPAAFWGVLERAIHIRYYRNIEDFYSKDGERDRRYVSRLVNAPIRVTRQQGDAALPNFYIRLKKNKTRITDDVYDLYRIVLPALFWLAVIGLAGPILACFRRGGRMSDLHVLYLGIAGTLLIQLLMFAVLKVTSFTSSIRLYFNLYPVLYAFVALGMLSVTRDLRALGTALFGAKPAKETDPEQCG